MGQGPGDDGGAPKRRPQPRQYRIYFLDAAEGEHSVIPFEARTDAEAYAAAKDHAGARPFELWNKDRLVIRRVASDAS
jgi:hypothetical protein